MPVFERRAAGCGHSFAGQGGRCWAGGVGRESGLGVKKPLCAVPSRVAGTGPVRGVGCFRRAPEAHHLLFLSPGSNPTRRLPPSAKAKYLAEEGGGGGAGGVPKRRGWHPQGCCTGAEMG